MLCLNAIGNTKYSEKIYIFCLCRIFASERSKFSEKQKEKFENREMIQCGEICRHLRKKIPEIRNRFSYVLKGMRNTRTIKQKGGEKR